MRIYLVPETDLDESRELSDAIEAAYAVGVSTVVFFEGNPIRSAELAAQRGWKYDVGVFPSAVAARLRPMWEQHFDTCVVRFPDRVEVRWYEWLSEDRKRYATHAELSAAELKPLDERRFLLGFYRSLLADPIDVRKAVRAGLSGVPTSRTVVP
jgi:hypothetical protein